MSGRKAAGRIGVSADRLRRAPVAERLDVGQVVD